MATKFNDFLNEQLKDPEVKKEYDALAPEFAIIQAMIDARQASGSLAAVTGDIDRLLESIPLYP